MLKNLSLNLSYNTSEHNISKDFYEPIFSNAVQYKRGVGYFTSGWLNHNAVGLAKLIENGGNIQFITSPILDHNDLEALEGKYDPEKIDIAILKNVDEIAKGLEKDTRNLLGWLVFDGIIEFKFAVPKNHLNGGEFHDKFGIIIDDEGDFVAFNGSMNDSIKSNYNYESISVFKSWGDDTSQFNAKDILMRFDRLWAEQDSNISIYSISEIVKNKLIEFKISENRPYSILKKLAIHKKPKKPLWLELRDYQKNAIREWFRNDGVGILAMATGSGKTITALTAATILLNEKKNIHFLVVVPYTHLLEQWAKEGEKFNYHFIKCNSDYPKWENELNNSITKSIFDSNEIISIITTTGTYKTERFQQQIGKLKNILLIVDEAHNFGSKQMRENYIENAVYKLGLSATPRRHMDDEGSQAIIDYLGDVIFTYDLKDAIEDGNLTRYYYYPVFVSLTEDENEDYFVISEKISNILKFSQNDDLDDASSALKILLIQRARILASASNKIVALKQLILDEKLENTKHNLFYTAAHIERGDDYEIKMVDKIVDILKSDIGMQVDKFTSTESKDEREYLIYKMTEGLTDGLVAIRCLDEGVDIPSVERAFIMASSTNPKEFIQRRGRVLRQSKLTGKKYAYIYDFLVIPNIENQNDATFRYERTYLEKELMRFMEFAKLAENAYEAEQSIHDLKHEYNLLHV